MAGIPETKSSNRPGNGEIQLYQFHWTKLPDTSRLQPLRGVPILTDKKDIKRWMTHVIRMLRTQCLGYLIDGSITTPPDNEAHLERYKLADAYVTQWMTKQISYKLYKRVKNTNLPIDTAQNLYNSIRQTMLKTSPAEIRRRWKTWVTLERANFATIPQYIDGLLKSYENLTDTGYPAPPIEAVYRLFYAIRDEMPLCANDIINKIDDIKPTEVTKEHLLEACARTRARAQERYSLPR